MQNAKSVCFPSEAISFFHQFFLSVFGYFLPGHWHILLFVWARKMVSGELWICAEKVPCVPCPQCHHIYHTFISYLPFTPQSHHMYHTFTIHLHHIYHTFTSQSHHICHTLMTPRRQQNAWAAATSHEQVRVGFGQWLTCNGKGVAGGEQRK